MFRLVIFISIFCPFLFSQQDLATSARLIADREVVAKGTAFRIGLELTMDDHWHTYWENPGSSGLPTTLEIEPIEGLTVGKLAFPLPKRFEDEYNMVTFGYDEKVLLIAEAVYNGPLPSLALKGKATWLECKEVCIPGEAGFELTLPIGEGKPANSALFDQFQAQIPVPYSDSTPFTYTSDFQFEGETWRGLVTLNAKDGHSFTSTAEEIQYFPLAIGLLDAELTAFKARKEGDQFHLELTHTAYVDAPEPGLALEGVVKVSTQAGTHLVRLPLYKVKDSAATPTPPKSTTGNPAPKEGSGSFNLWVILFIAFLGGMILNLMPCVLPVLSLKVFTVIQDAGMSASHRIKHAWIVTLGVSVSFLVISMFFIVSKILGNELGVGFQFQNPYFVIGISALIFVMALNFFDVFHLEPPASNDLYQLTQRQGWQGAFFQGALMTILSTPCTAPLLGTAYAWALSQPPLLIFLTFQIIALGLAFPYLILCHSPKLMALLPKPGNWMNYFKHGLGFLLMGTLIWLLSVLWELTGSAGLIGTLTLLLGLAIAAYIFGQTFFSEHRIKGFFWMAAVLLISGYVGMFRLYDIQQPFLAKQKHYDYLRLTFLSESGNQASQSLLKSLEEQRTTAEEIAWVPYSQANLEYFRNQGRIVFMDFTAAWCLNCKTNEKVFIDTKTIRTAMAEKSVVMMKVDYTDKSDEITVLLKSFNRAGVPLYLFYPGNQEPIVLPEVISKSMLLEGLSSAAQILTQKTQM